MAKTLSRELRICLAIWRKAFLERGDEPLVINCRDYNSAIAIRQSMYRAIKPFRTNEMFDEDLRQAAEFLVVYLEKQDDPTAPHRLIMKERKTLDDLNAEMEALGIGDADLLLEEEKIVTGKLDEFIEEAREEARATSFYSRD